MNFILQWIDVIWLAVAWFVPRADQRWVALYFVASCMLMMRLQIETMAMVGYPDGMLGFLGWDVATRGFAAYALVYVIYFLMVHFSPHTKGSILMATSIGIFFTAFFASSVLMVF